MPSASSIDVSPTPELRAWITAQVAQGRDRSAGEAVRRAVRRLQEQSAIIGIKRIVRKSGRES